MEQTKGPPSAPPQVGFTPAQNYPEQQYPAQNYPAQSYPAQGYPPQGYPGQQLTGQNYPPQVYPPQVYPPQNYGPPPTVQQPYVPVVPQGGWFSRNQRNKPQANAVGSAGVLFVSGGMKIAWSVGFRNVLATVHMQVCWFVAAIIGALLASILANHVPKKYVIQFTSLLVLIGGIVMACTEYNAQAITAAFYLDGIANGLAFVATLSLAGEVAVPYMRGLITTTTEQMCFALGILLQIIFASTWSWDVGASISTDQIHGILSGIYGLIALIMCTFLTIESPVIMLANGQEQQAIDALRRLQRPYALTTETYEQLAEHKRYLEHNKDLSLSQSITQAMPAFMRLCFLRALNAMSMSAFMAAALLIPSIALYQRGNWPFIVFGCFRFLGSFFTIFTMESAGRKKPTLVGLLFCSGLAFAIGYEYNHLSSGYYYISSYTHSVIIWLICIFQVFAAIAFTPTSAYISEAYPLGVKHHFIGATFIVEMLVYIIIQVCDFSLTGLSIFFYVFGGFSIFAFLVGIFWLPETKLTSLRAAQEKFRGFNAKGF